MRIARRAAVTNATLVAFGLVVSLVGAHGHRVPRLGSELRAAHVLARAGAAGRGQLTALLAVDAAGALT
jgi:hypothetical protein